MASPGGQQSARDELSAKARQQLQTALAEVLQQMLRPLLASIHVITHKQVQDLNETLNEAVKSLETQQAEKFERMDRRLRQLRKMLSDEVQSNQTLDSRKDAGTNKSPDGRAVTDIVLHDGTRWWSQGPTMMRHGRAGKHATTAKRKHPQRATRRNPGRACWSKYKIDEDGS